MARRLAAAALAGSLLLGATACTATTPTPTTTPTPSHSVPSDSRPTPSGTIGTASLTDPSGHPVGSATFTQHGTDVELALTVTHSPGTWSLRVSAAPASAECPGDEYSLDFGQEPAATTTRRLPGDIMPEADPTMWRSLLLIAPATPGPFGRCAATVLASAAIDWTREPAGLSRPIHDSGAAEYARGAVASGASGPATYTPAAGDTATAVAARLGITVGDLHWLNPLEFDLRAGMPINLDPAARGLPAQQP